MAEKGYSLVSQQIRNLIIEGFIKVPESNLSQHPQDIPTSKIKKGFFVDARLEQRVQPSSFEPSLSDELFVLDTEGYGLPRPGRNESVYRMILEMPLRKRTLKSIVGGFEAKSGFTYLVKLNEKLSATSKITSIRSSPKSSIGRLFPKTRFLVDYNASFDEVSTKGGKDIDMWLVVQPLPINFILHPNLNLNQLRFFSGDAKLSDEELVEEYKNQPLLYEKNKDKEKRPIPLTPDRIVDGLRIWLDISGKDTHGVFGLKARKNPDSIDLAKIGFYEPEKYFSPIISGGRNTIKKDHYLFSSHEILQMPSHLSAELKRHFREGIEGRIHDAGFVDPGFVGDMVYEVSSDEETETEIREMPLSSLEFFRSSEVPDKIYGEEIDSNYQGQTGPRTSKHFKPFDYEYAARNHNKLSRIVLVNDATILHKFRNVSEGFEPIFKDKAEELFKVLRSGFFHSRYDCEEDDLLLQPIPYTIVFSDDGKVLSYIRTTEKENYGDERLLGKHSIGLGGHVTKEDAPEYIERCLEREVSEEEVRFVGERSSPKLIGTIFAKTKPVDRVHFGLVYSIVTKGEVISNEKSIDYVEFVPIDKIMEGHRGAETETWSRILIPHLNTIYKSSL